MTHYRFEFCFDIQLNKKYWTYKIIILLPFADLGNKCITFVLLINNHEMKVNEVIKLITKDGWYQLKSTGTSHRQYKHPIKKGRVTIPGKPSDELPPKTLKSIFEQAGFK